MVRVFKKLYRLFFEIIKDRRLLIELSKKDFSRRFAGSYFGIAWGFINPLLTMCIYWAVFQFGFRSGDVGDIPFVLWFMCGIIPWLFISEAFSTASNSFIEYSYLVKKVVFNINILPMVKIISALFIHLFFLCLLMIICIFFGIYPNIYWIQIIYYLFCAIIFVFALSLIFSSIIVFFRDLNQVIGIILLIGMWGTPIAWNINIFPKQTQLFLKLNPLYYIIEGYRDSFLMNTWFWQKYNLTIYFWFVTILLLLVGAFLYHRLRDSFADSL